MFLEGHETDIGSGVKSIIFSVTKGVWKSRRKSGPELNKDLFVPKFIYWRHKYFLKGVRVTQRLLTNENPGRSRIISQFWIVQFLLSPIVYWFTKIVIYELIKPIFSELH